MDASTLSSSTVVQPIRFQPNTESIKRKLVEKGVHPTPKIVHAIRKKEIQKHNRKIQKMTKAKEPPPLTSSQKQVLSEEMYYHSVRREYLEFTKNLNERNRKLGGSSLPGKPWESVEKARFLDAWLVTKGNFRGSRLKKESLSELKEVFRGNLDWVLEDDAEIEIGDSLSVWDPTKRRKNLGEAIRFLVEKLSRRNVTVKDWKLTKLMKLSGLRVDEGQLLKIVEGLQRKRKWEQALAVVDWAYNRQGEPKSRIVYKRILSFLGKERKPQIALKIFKTMLEDCNTFPDISTYHTIAITLGQAGLMTELLKVIRRMKQGPRPTKNWVPVLEPDLVVHNSVLNACVSSGWWKGVLLVFHMLRRNRMKPNGATYGLAMEVMLIAGKYDILHKIFVKMLQSGQHPTPLTYRVLVKSLWVEGRVIEAVQAVRDMERREVVGVASVYYELACCLCNNGKWQDALTEIENLKMVRRTKPLAVTFTGLIQSAMEGGHLEDCKSIFVCMKEHCTPNTGTINTMIRVYSKSDSFAEAKDLFEKAVGNDAHSHSIRADEYTYNVMLEASARAQQWEYFDFVYKQMVFHGYQLDQTKHAALLVEASAHGKGHLLEHAFDAALEAEEIPAPPFFFEMLLQAMSRQDYGKAINIVNIMACAPFRVPERQWINLFQKNNARIETECLQKLQEALIHCDFESETTVVNLARSLRNLLATSSLGSEDDQEAKISSMYEIVKDNHANDSPDSNGSTEVEFLGVDRANQSSVLIRSSDDEDFEEWTSEEDEQRESDTPSAEEILHIWREGRRTIGRRYSDERLTIKKF